MRDLSWLMDDQNTCQRSRCSITITNGCLASEQVTSHCLIFQLVSFQSTGDLLRAFVGVGVVEEKGEEVRFKKYKYMPVILRQPVRICWSVLE